MPRAGEGQPPSEETITFQCPSCAAVSKVPARFAGKRGRCGKCKATLEVPGAAPAGKPPTRLRREQDLAPADPEDAGAEDEGEDAATPRDCPYCFEPIAARAKKCKHCGEWLDKKVRRARAQTRAPGAAKVPVVLAVYGWIFAAFGVLGMLFGLLNAVVKAELGLLVAVLVYFLLAVTGVALARGKRAGVVGVVVFAALGLCGSLLMLGALAALRGDPNAPPDVTPATEMAPLVAVVALGCWGALYPVPVYFGLAHWNRLS